SHRYVQRVQVGFGVDGHAAQPGVTASPHYPHGDLAAVRDQHLAHCGLPGSAAQSLDQVAHAATLAPMSAWPMVPKTRCGCDNGHILLPIAMNSGKNPRGPASGASLSP